ncbi:hypothetical protein I4F81_002702 [Pyropia yezoensis]|uniref:Uncharacterized protein n=1 Tax=Pyropia yezoensis TaxID=2788 RepID=A0ACC3BRH5_PYRYE|nr:hypothetical protein I4F81_002702 [Neopyropia yezoensis]
MVTGPINKFLARGSQHPRSQASPGRVFTVPKLSAVASTFVGNLSFSACLSSAFLPPGMTARSLAEYSKGGAVIFYDATAPLKLLLTPDQNRHFLACIERGVCKIGDVVTVKVHTAMLSQPEPHTLRAASNMVLAVAPTGCPGIFMDSLPIPLAWAKSLPPWCVFSSVLTLNMQTIRSMGATSSVQVVDRVGEHAMLTMPSRNLSNLLGELNRVTLTDVLFPSLCSPSNASRAFHFGDGATVEGVFKEVNFTTGMTYNQTYWWVPMVSTPVPTLEADRIAREWMAHAEPGANNVFYDLVPVDVGAAADAVVDLVADESTASPTSALLGAAARRAGEEEAEEEEEDRSPAGAPVDAAPGASGGGDMITSYSGSADTTDVSARRL